jgi:hypothetical protein
LRDSVEPPDEVAGLDSEHLDQALVRLLEHGLVDGKRQETIGFASWTGLRVTARGMQVLGEWPDLDQLASAVGVKMLLNELAKSAPNEEQSSLRRMVGVIGDVGEGVAMSTLNATAADLGGGLADG